VKVPKNSDASADEIDFVVSEEEKVINEKGEVVKEAIEFVDFDKTLITNSIFDMGNLLVFPHKARDGDVPLRLLKIQKPDYVFEVA
jgi:hypothetical protein